MEITEEEVIKKAEKEVTEAEQEELDADEANRTAHPAEKDEDRIPYKVLQNEAKKLGKRYIGVSRKDLEKSVEGK